jgi:hypothetical protein
MHSSAPDGAGFVMTAPGNESSALYVGTNQRQRIRFAVVCLACFSMLTMVAFYTSGSGSRYLELTSSSVLKLGNGGLTALVRATNKLKEKSALLNRLLAHSISTWALDRRGQVRPGRVDRAIASKARLLEKFQRESGGVQLHSSSTSSSHYEELSQLAASSGRLDKGTTSGNRGLSPAVSNNKADGDSTDNLEEPIEKKVDLLNNILDDAAFNLGPEESESYHAPETADLDDEIADIKELADEQHVKLPPLVPSSDVVHGAHGLFAARIEGKVVNVVDGVPVSGATVELVGPNEPLPPNMIQEVSKNGPLHPEVDKVLRNLARGFAVIGLKNKQQAKDATLGAYQVSDFVQVQLVCVCFGCMSVADN